MRNKFWRKSKRGLALFMGITVSLTSMNMPVLAAEADDLPSANEAVLDEEPGTYEGDVPDLSQNETDGENREDEAGDNIPSEEDTDSGEAAPVMLNQEAGTNYTNESPSLPGMGEQLYINDFTNMDELDTYPGNNAGDFNCVDNALTITGGSGNKAIVKEQSFTDFVIEADVTVDAQADMGDKSSSQAGILFRASEASGNVADGYNGYYFCVDAKNSKVTLGKTRGNQWTELASKKTTVNFGETYHLTVAVSGDKISCYVDYNGNNFAKIEAKDSDHAAGSVGVRNWLSNASYRNIRVSAYTEPEIEGDTYTNPLLSMCADPDVLYYNGTYYLYPTNAGDANDDQGIKVYTSTDLIHWADKGWALSKDDVWGNANFWAPDIIERDGTFYMYYVSEEHLCVATSKSPLGPFVQEEKKPMHDDIKEIDAHVFQDDDGQYYIYFVRFDNGNVIEGAKLNDDMMTMDDSTITRVLTPDTGWETDMARVNEGPFMLKKDGVYYLTYSGSHFESNNYGSGYATSDSPLGPYTKYENNPIMQSNSMVHGAGHHGIAESPDGQELFMIYHCHNNLKDTEPRRLCIDRLQFTEDADGNTVLEVKGPTVTPQAAPSGSVNVDNLIEVKSPEGENVVENGTAPEDWNIQASLITSAQEKGVEKKAAVEWNAEGYDPADKEEQKLQVTGTVILPEGVENLGNIPLTVTANVTVKRDMSTEDSLDEILGKVEIRNKDNIMENITLPTEQDGLALTWKSDKESVISTKEKENDNYYTTPAGVVTRQDKDTSVTLTVSAEKDGVTKSREIKTTVKAKPEKKEYTAYLYAHFKEHPGQVGEQDVFFGISKNGLDWTALNNNEAVLKSEVGDKKVRDPYIIRSADGDKFYLIATDQNIYQYGGVDWDKLSTQGSQALTIWESTDLVNWTDHRRVVVADSVNAGCAWAPEAIYDEGTGEYLVYWSSKVADDNYARQYNFVSKTRDFYTFTEPEVYNDLGSNIDTSIHKEGNKYYKLIKLEEGDNTHVILQSAEDHPLAYGEEVNEVVIGDKSYKNLGANYTQIDNSADGCLESFRGPYEGATMFKFNDRDEWCVMVDEYGGQTRGYIPFISDDLDKPNNVKALSNNDYIMQDGGKHGVILPITQEEYDALTAKWGVAKEEINETEQKEPVISYDFEEELADGTIKDKSGNNLNAALFGNAAYKYDEEKKSNVLYLDGSKGTYAQLPTGFFDGMDNLTISMDVKPETTETNHVDFSIGQDNNRYMFIRFRDYDITSGITTRSWQNEYKLVDGETGRLNKWVNVKVVVEGHKMSMYVDDQLIAVNPHVRSIQELGADLISYLGKSFYDDPYFKGCYDNIQIYNRAMSSDEIVTERKMKVKMEAENARLTLPAKAVDRGDASGGRKVGTIDNSSATVTFTLDAPKAGTYRVDIVSGSGTDQPNASAKYYVNGDISNAKIVDYIPKGWDVWTAYPVEVELNKGLNTFTVTHSGRANSFSELDYITFYNYNPKLDSITLDGEPLEGFDTNTHEYSVEVKDLSKIPEIKAQMAEESKDYFDVKVTQADNELLTGKVEVTSPLDESFHEEYTIRLYDSSAFSNPLVNYGADPYVTYQDGYYYYVRVHKDKEIYVSRSKELNRIAATQPYMVYTPAEGEPDRELWAPEIHYLNGKWYIYYTAGAGNDHRMYVLESKTDNALGEYEFKGKLAPTTDKWAIDQTVLEYNGKLYAVWSGWEGDVNVEQRIYIAQMSDPCTISSERVELSRPEYAWELNGTPRINEGAQIAVSPDGITNIIYSASGSWTDDYCLGRLTLKKDGDPMNPDDWEKGTEAVFMKNAPSTYSTGHACFTTSPDGTESYIVYHATRGAGQGWNGRGVRTQKFTWNEDGTPNFGKAIAYDAKVNKPSGTPDTERTRIEAESGELANGAAVEETYNSSAGKKVTGLDNEGASVTFKADVKDKGTYKLYLGAATSADNAGLAVSVNGGEAVAKEVVSFNASPGNGLCVDNWMGYELEVELNRGENTVSVGKSAELTAADLDYIELELLEKAPSAAWVQDGDRWMYQNEDGSFVKDDWKLIEGKWYHFDQAGYRQSGWIQDGKTWYYLADDGVMVTGWLSYGNAWYYLKSSGAMATGWIQDGQHWYYLKGDGKMATGWLQDGKTWYYLKGNGMMATGWLQDGKTWYYLKSNGAMATGWLLDGKNWYYLRSNGAMVTGWMLDGKTWYYLKSNGMMATGWLKDGKTWYYLKSSGAMATGWLLDGKTWYYLRSSGAMATGWLKDGKTWYYLKNSGAMATGWLKLGSTWYYLKDNGAMATGWIKVQGKWYYCQSSGKMVADAWVGKYYVNESGVWTRTR